MWFCTSAYICFAGMSWCPRVPAAWPWWEHLSAPVPLRQTLAAGVHGDRCRGASGIFRVTPRPSFSTRLHSIRDEGGQSRHRNAFAATLVFPRSVSVFVLCFHITSLALLLKQQQRKRNIGLCGCQYRACQNLVLAGLKPPDGGGTVCVCVFSFFFLFPLLLEKS